MKPSEMRYSSHLRWQIENNVFKLMNKLFETKKYRGKNRTCIDNLYLINIIAFNILQLYLGSKNLKKISENVVVTIKYWCNLLFESLNNYTHCRNYDSS